jgi:deoxyribose-phosphate aldolase
MVGFKPAGGISSAADALCYYSIVSSLLGKAWLNKEWFRFGVSRVANSILSAVEQKTVSFF